MKQGFGKLSSRLVGFNAWVVRYRTILFLVVLSLLYGFIIYRINALTTIRPTSSDITAQETKSPNIDKATIDNIQKLQDNSVNVQSLFDPSRNNPFQ